MWQLTNRCRKATTHPLGSKIGSPCTSPADGSSGLQSAPDIIRWSCSMFISTSRGLEPSGGPRTPASWSWSTTRAARP